MALPLELRLPSISHDHGENASYLGVPVSPLGNYALKSSGINLPAAPEADSLLHRMRSYQVNDRQGRYDLASMGLNEGYIAAQMHDRVRYSMRSSGMIERA